MASIYLSHSHTDTEKATLVAKKLEEKGYSVFVDNRLQAGESWFAKIESEIAISKAVIVLWSATSVGSRWVRAEASQAVSEAKLVPIKIEQVAVPLGFRVYQTANLTAWRGEEDNPDWQAVLRSLSQLTSKSSSAVSLAEDPGQPIILSADRDYSKPRRVSKTRLFIAHASNDKPKLRGMIEVLVKTGFLVWIDKPHNIGLPPELENRIKLARIRVDADWKEQIRRAISRSDVVLACWSTDAVEGRREQFHYEVYQGLIGMKLKQCRIDKISLDKIGMPYNFHQIADLSVFRPGCYHPELDYLIQDISESSGRHWLRFVW